MIDQLAATHAIVWRWPAPTTAARGSAWRSRSMVSPSVAEMQMAGPPPRASPAPGPDAQESEAAEAHLTAHGYVAVPEQSLRSPEQLDKLVAMLLELRGQMSWPASEDEGGALPPPGEA